MQTPVIIDGQEYVPYIMYKGAMSRQRILEDAIKTFCDARGRYNTQKAAYNLGQLVGRQLVNPDDKEPENSEPVRPNCCNCGSPASYRALHNEAGSVYVCEHCAMSHRTEHVFFAKIWPPEIKNKDGGLPFDKEYVGHVMCRKCNKTHWINGPCLK